MKELKKSRNLKLIDGKWYIDFTFRGRRYREFGGWTKEQARNTLVKLRADLLDVARGFKKAPVDDLGFSAFADQFLELHSKPNKRSWRGDESSMQVLKAHFGNEPLRSITAENVSRFVAELRVGTVKNTGAPISPATVNRYLALLKTMFQKGIEWGRLEANPASLVKKLKEPPPRDRILTKDEAGRLLAAAEGDFRAILIVALGTGMRRGEILALRWKDVDLTMGIITVAMSKSGKARRIPMSGAVAEALGAVSRRGEFVFWNPETRTHRKDVKTAFHLACARAKITGFRFHDLRHTALTWMLRSGADIVSVSKIAGHSSIVMTQRYCHASAEFQRRAVEHVGAILDSTRQNLDTGPETVSIPRPAASSVNASSREN